MNHPMFDASSLPYYEWLDVPVWVFDAQRMRKVWANNAGLAYWNAATLEELLSRDDAHASAGARARLELTMQAHARGELTRVSWTMYPDGQPVTCELLSRGYRLADGRQAVMFVAERRAANLEPSTPRDVEGVHRTNAHISLHSLVDGAVLMRNTAAHRALGSPSSPGKGDAASNAFIAMFAETAAGARLFQAAQEGRSTSGDFLLRTFHGDLWHAIDIRPVPDPVSGGRALHFNARDIGELKAVQHSLELARSAAHAAQLAKNTFLANVSHEIRTPMSSVLGLTEMALRSGELSDRQRRFISLAHQSARGLMVTLNDLIEVAQHDAGQTTVAREPFSVRDCVMAAIAPLIATADVKGLRLNWRVEAGVPDVVLGDGIRLRQVIDNLVGNALKFTPAGEVHLNVRPCADASRDPDEVVLSLTVRDTGIGMTPEQVGRVFEPFVQADVGSARRYGGAGLGLTVVARSVALMGGEVKVDSTPGGGSCFGVTLPMGRSVTAIVAPEQIVG